MGMDITQQGPFEPYRARVIGVKWTGPTFAPRSIRSVELADDDGNPFYIVVEGWPGGEEGAEQAKGKWFLLQDTGKGEPGSPGRFLIKPLKG